MSKQLPERVRLREERVWHQTVGGIYPEGEWVEYKYRGDAALDRLMIGTTAEPLSVLRQWREAAGLEGRHGPYLVSGPLQKFLGLPVRQLYVHGSELYRIETDGHVTTKLL